MDQQVPGGKYHRIVYNFLTAWLIFLVKPVLHFATELNSSVIQKCNVLGVPSYDLFTSAHRLKQYFLCPWWLAFTDWETRGPLCFLSWSTIMAQEEDVPGVHPLWVEFKYSIRGQEIIMCNRNWWKEVWGRSNLPQKSSTVLSEPKFGPPPPPNKKFLDLPLMS